MHIPLTAAALVAPISHPFSEDNLHAGKTHHRCLPCGWWTSGAESTAYEIPRIGGGGLLRSTGPTLAPAPLFHYFIISLFESRPGAPCFMRASYEYVTTACMSRSNSPTQPSAPISSRVQLSYKNTPNYCGNFRTPPLHANLSFCLSPIAILRRFDQRSSLLEFRFSVVTGFIRPRTKLSSRRHVRDKEMVIQTCTS